MGSMIDTILIVLGGMIFGGFIFSRIEPVLNHKLEKKSSIPFSSWGIMRFIGIFLIVLSYFYLKYHFVTGVGIGMVIFSIRPSSA